MQYKWEFIFIFIKKKKNFVNFSCRNQKNLFEIKSIDMCDDLLHSE